MLIAYVCVEPKGNRLHEPDVGASLLCSACHVPGRLHMCKHCGLVMGFIPEDVSQSPLAAFTPVSSCSQWDKHSCEQDSGSDARCAECQAPGKSYECVLSGQPMFFVPGSGRWKADAPTPPRMPPPGRIMEPGKTCRICEAGPGQSCVC